MATGVPLTDMISVSVVKQRKRVVLLFFLECVHLVSVLQTSIPTRTLTRLHTRGRQICFSYFRFIVHQYSWIETERKMEWRLAMRIASLPETRWTKKAARWNPALSVGTKAYRAVGRPKRWEDEVNQFLKPEETDETKGNGIKNNDTWIWVAKDQEKGKHMEDDFAAASKVKTPGSL